MDYLIPGSHPAATNAAKHDSDEEGDGIPVDGAIFYP
jgi:hypothetical protein